ncbi:putative transposase 7 [Escherichia albertii TW07627]|uniref:Transposase 7 n=1 Tax=Escherichia albertii (strain TW07627) TaxID=502347 RepID=A0ABC9NK91_ESCAT|nr:putative transposase 7 [Escherichia albertii TW07627]
MISGARLHKVISQNQVKPVIKFRRKADLISKKTADIS